MDGAEERLTNRSLFRRMAVYLSATILGVGLLGAGLSFFSAFEQARDLQDDQLKQIAWLFPAGEMAEQLTDGVLRGDADEAARILIFRVQQAQPSTDKEDKLPLRVAGTLPDGWHTVTAHHDTWRVYLRTLKGAERIAVAQRTEARDDIARRSGWLTLFPLLGLIPVLILIAALLVRFFLKSITRLSRQVDEMGDTNLTPLARQGVPSEILPFVRSINRLLERLALSLEQQRRFVADAAHELRTPVAALTIQVENLGQVDLPAPARERLKSVAGGLKRMRALLEQLLELARFQAKPEMVDERFDATALTKQVIGDLLPLAEAKGVDLGMIHMDALTMRGRADDLGSILRNALDNAIRYTPRGGRIDVSLRRDTAGAAMLEVRDTGPGIPADMLTRVFDPFYRVLGTGEAGSGLGLAIVRSAATRLHGQVSAANAVDGQGGLIVRFVQPPAVVAYRAGRSSSG
ncbi:ATP-binding protein [Pandoraea sp.]|uniref:ATP-binding protein n=1 Tax=Pandoraea sp. TaxID=1883445 RepID=UPI00121A90E2|nr:ATP-binding protein [Pandoraea sp.]TAL54481.1 MAG: hypothetical protein EPN80_12005 [Pandoraea sp.]TAM17529.1 MAG: hypothetical protein EPN65_11115 [Pandoraea sp.]